MTSLAKWGHVPYRATSRIIKDNVKTWSYSWKQAGMHRELCIALVMPGWMSLDSELALSIQNGR